MAFEKRLLMLVVMAACLLGGSVAPAGASWFHHGESKPSEDAGTMMLKTASNKKIKVTSNALKQPVWHRFSKQSRYTHRMQKASKESGFPTVASKPAFSDTIWHSLPKKPQVAHAMKTHMPHMPHRNGAPARPKLAGKRHWLW
jgi:hypothetical protein